MKKNVVLTLLSLALTSALLAGCGATGTTTGTASSTKSASNSAVSGSVATNGSTSMEKVIGALGEQFMKDNPDVKVSYDATGSGTGVEAVSNGTCDIGLSSRALKNEETDKGLVGTKVALDGIAIIVNSDNPVDNLTTKQLASMFTGNVKDWSEVGGDSGEVACIGRESGSGTRDGFESITKTADQCKLSQELTSTGAVIEAVKGSPNAIGYASFSDVKRKTGVKAITVDGVACSADTIRDGSYKIQRPFVLVTKKDATLSKAAKAFFDFATSKKASSLIKNAGAVSTAK